jgi:hypothetical protein
LLIGAKKMQTPRRILLALGAATLAGAAAFAHDAPPQQEGAEKPADKKPQDRDFVIAAGMTEKEADCWELIAKAAGAFFDLPEMHPMDKGEIATAIHIVQNKLLSRPTYRKYLETAKASVKKP